MKKFQTTTSRNRLKSSLTFLLVLTAIACYYGATNLIENGGGKSIGLSHDFLDMTIIKYLFPGIVVFYLIGLFTIIVFVLCLSNKKNYKWLLICEGALLLVWSAVQLLLLGFPFIPLHLLLMALGVIFILSELLSPIQKPNQ